MRILITMYAVISVRGALFCNVNQKMVSLPKKWLNILSNCRIEKINCRKILMQLLNALTERQD